MRLAFAGLVCFSILSASAQTITPVPRAGENTVSVVTPAASVGYTIALLASDTKCDASSSPLPLTANTNSAALKTGTTTLTLQNPLKQGQILCATTIKGTDAATKHLGPSVVVDGTAAVDPLKTPLVKPSDGLALSSTSDVTSSVTVDPLLVPASIARKVFGKEVSNQYAVVQLTISNHNQDAALILQSVILDYSHWLFSNNFQGPLAHKDRTVTTNKYQAANDPWRISSAEARTVRGDMQEAQPWTVRNTSIRALQLVAAVASGYQFLTVDPNYLSGISAFGSQFVPAVATFWPDSTPTQINRVTDYGFQTNHIIPKGSADIIYAFFPLNSFLTPSLCKTFIKNPAVFFVPGEMLIDPKYTKVLADQLKSSGLINPAATKEQAAGRVAEALAHYEYARSGGVASNGVLTINGVAISTAPSQSAAAQKTNIKPAAPQKTGTTPSPADDGTAKSSDDSSKPTAPTDAVAVLNQDDLVLLELLQRASLSNVSVVVGGIMTVDTNSIPAVLDNVTLADENLPATWSTVPGTLKGSITGSYLTDGTVTISPATNIGAITTDPDSSSDKNLAFSFPLTAAIAQGTTLTFTVTKVAKDKSSVISKPFTYKVLSALPQIATVTPDAAATWAANTAVTGKISGTKLTGGKPAADNGLTCSVADAANNNDTTLSFSCTHTAAIASATKINFTVTIKAADGTSLTSIPYAYTVP